MTRIQADRHLRDVIDHGATLDIDALDHASADVYQEWRRHNANLERDARGSGRNRRGLTFADWHARARATFAGLTDLLVCEQAWARGEDPVQYARSYEAALSEPGVRMIRVKKLPPHIGRLVDEQLALKHRPN